MKRVDLIRHPHAQGAYLLREPGKHSVYVNSANNRTTAVPRHQEINDHLCWKICRDLGIVEP